MSREASQVPGGNEQSDTPTHGPDSRHDLVSVTSADLLLSMLAPRGWEPMVKDESNFGVFGDPDEGGYRPNITFLLGEPEQPGVAWFRGLMRDAPGQLAATLTGYEELSTDEFRLSSRAGTFEICYRQHADCAPPTSHLQAYVWVDSHRMYVVNGATLRSHESRDLPLFDGVLRSLRVLPERH
jgi:hypothetical protein